MYQVGAQKTLARPPDMTMNSSKFLYDPTPSKVVIPVKKPSTETLIETSDWNEVLTLSKKSYVLVYFWAKWCPVCRGSAPVFKNISKEMQGFSVKFVKF